MWELQGFNQQSDGNFKKTEKAQEEVPHRYTGLHKGRMGGAASIWKLIH